MGKYAILLVLATLTLITPFMESSRRSKLEAVDDMTMRYEIRNMQNAATSYAAMTLHLVTLAKDNGEYDSDDFSYKENSDIYDDTVITVRADNLDIGVERITVTATKNNITGTAMVETSQLPYSYYAQFLNSFNGIYYGNGEGITGPVHINGRLGVGQIPGPVFNGNVTTTGPTKYYAGATKSNFKGFLGDGIDENHRRITIPNHLGFIDNSQAFDLDSVFPKKKKIFTRLTDNATGQGILEVYDVPANDPHLKSAGFMKNHRIIILLDEDLPQDYRVLYTTRELHMEGQMNGQLTIASEGEIFIDGDLTYKDDPRTNPASTDLLGIVSAEDIYISSRKDPHAGQDKYKNENDVMLMAAIFTLKSIKIENFYKNKWKGPKSRGTWTTYGSRLQEYPSPTWNGGSNYIGFKEQVEYDPRLRHLRPPGIPFTNEQKTSRWVESFTLN